jgi:S1-C subfamily serine protease
MFTTIVLSAFLAQGQEDREKLKKEILERVEAMIREEEAKLLKRVQELLDRELASSKPEEKKPDAAEAPAKKRGFLGVNVSDLTDDDRDEFKVKPDEGGVKVTNVVPDSAADGKIEIDDIILQVNGVKVTDFPSLAAEIQKAGGGAEVTFSIAREGKRQEIKIKIGIHPDDQ